VPVQVQVLGMQVQVDYQYISNVLKYSSSPGTSTKYNKTIT